jgi:hypothetical protein
MDKDKIKREWLKKKLTEKEKTGIMKRQVRKDKKRAKVA